MTTVDDRPMADLLKFGYQQQLERKVGTFASFAVGFSFVSILTTVFQFFGAGYGFGGTAFFWTWPIVFAGQLLVALCFAELAARYPLSGAIYQWSRRLGGAVIGWFAGWTMILAQIVALAAIATALQVVLPVVWSGFQLVGSDPNPTTPSGAANAVILGVILLTITTALNLASVRITAIVSSVGVVCELVGVALVVVLLFTRAERGPSVVLHATNLTPTTGYFGPLLVSSLMAGYVLVGFDSAGELSEETRNPRRTAPRTILRALVVSGVGGALLIVVALMAAPSLTDGNLASQGLPYVLTSRLGTVPGKMLLVDVSVAIFVCTLAIQAAASRMIFSMGRDRLLPGSALLAKVSLRTGTPLLSIVVPGVVAAALLLVNIGNPALFLALGSICILLMYLAYLMVTGPMLVLRLRGHENELETDETGKPLYSLGRWGTVINLVAVFYGLGMAINLGWPRAEVFDPAGGHWYLRFLGPISVAVTILLGLAAYAAQRHDYHAAIGAEPPRNWLRRGAPELAGEQA